MAHPREWERRAAISQRRSLQRRQEAEQLAAIGWVRPLALALLIIAALVGLVALFLILAT